MRAGGKGSASRVWYVVFASVAVYAVMLALSDFSGLSEIFLSWSTVSAVLLLAFGNYLLRAARFHYYIKAAGAEVPLRKSLLVFFSGMLMTITPGKIGEVWKSHMLKKSDGIRIRRTVPAVFSERLSDVIGVIAIAVVSSYAFVGEALSLSASVAFVSLIALAVYSRRVYRGMRGIAMRIGVLRKHIQKIDDVYEGVRSINSPLKLAVSVILSIAAWSLECIALWMIVADIGYPIPLGIAFFVYSASSLTGSLSTSPGGIGVTEGGMYLMLIGFGLGSAAASVSVIAVRFATLWFAIACAAVSLWVFRKIYGVSAWK